MNVRVLAYQFTRTWIRSRVHRPGEADTIALTHACNGHRRPVPGCRFQTIIEDTLLNTAAESR